MSDTEEKPMPAMDEWYKRREGRTDRPRICVWMPSSLPCGHVQTMGHGCSQPETLPPGPIMGGITIGGVDFEGPLEDIELLFAAAVEELARIREIADDLEVLRDAP